MTASSDDPLTTVRQELDAWHATHPRATFGEIEVAVEERIRHIRSTLLAEQVGTGFRDERPACPECGETMVPRSRSRRTVTAPGEEAVVIERAYVVCPGCGTGLFPPR